MSDHRFLCLGAGEGWHANQLLEAAQSLGCELHFATYESLVASVSDENGCQPTCEAGALRSFQAILTRTMPAGSLEQVTFRLATLHSIVDSSDAQSSPPIVNPPRSLELAIDKFATLARVADLGYRVPETKVAQSRGEAMDAFHSLGRDCIVKPIFGGEGRGVMRVKDAELAWYTFSTLENLHAVCYVQRFVPPGGSDTRLLVIGDLVLAVRRTNGRDFRTNVSSGGTCEAVVPPQHQVVMAQRICRSIGLKFASVDLIDSDDGEPRVLEVNAIPGWRGAQGVADFNIAQRIVRLLQHEASCYEASC